MDTKKKINKFVIFGYVFFTLILIFGLTLLIQTGDKKTDETSEISETIRNYEPEGYSDLIINRDGERIFVFEDERGTYEVNEEMYINDDGVHTAYSDTYEVGRSGRTTKKVVKIFNDPINVYEDGGWKRIENARSLINSGITFKKIEDDRRYNYDIIDFNYTNLKINPKLNDEVLDVDVPIKRNGREERTIRYDDVRTREEVEIKGDILKSNFTIGEHSTTFQVNRSGYIQGYQEGATYWESRNKTSYTDVTSVFEGYSTINNRLFRSGLVFNTTGLIPSDAIISSFNISIYITNTDNLANDHLFIGKNGTWNGYSNSLSANTNFTGYVAGTTGVTPPYGGINMTEVMSTVGMTVDSWFNITGSSAGKQQLQDSGRLGQPFRIMFLSLNDTLGIAHTENSYSVVGDDFQVQPVLYVEYDIISPSSPISGTLDNLRLNSTSGTNYTNEDLFVSFTPIVNNTDTPLTADVSFIPSFTQGQGFGNGLLLHYHFDDDEENITDYSGYGINGSVMGATFNSSGKIGGAYDFDGTDDYIEVDENLEDGSLSNGFTISAWIKPESVGESSEGRIIDKSSGILGSNGIALMTIPTNRISFKVNLGNNIYSAENSVIFGDGNWYHVLVTVNSSATLTYYINGAQSGTPATTGALAGITTSNALRIGNRATATDRTFDGLIDEVMIINRTLTTNEISQLYTKQSNKFTNLPATNGTQFESKLMKQNTTKYEIWNSIIRLYNAEGTITNSTNTLTILNSPPSVPTLNLPIDGIRTVNYTMNISILNSSDYDGDSINYEFYVDYETDPPTTLVSNATNQSMVYSLGGDGSYYWRARANDGESVSSYTSVRNINVDRRFIIINYTSFNHSVVEGSFQLFTINITKNNLTVEDVEAQFFYDNTSIEVTKSSEGNDRIFFNSSFFIPYVTSNPTINYLNWNFTITQLNGTNVNNNSFSGGQSVSKLYLDNCTVYSIEIFNFTLVDEETQLILTNGSSMEISFNIFSKDGAILISNLSNIYNSNPVRICGSSSLANYSTDVIVKYESIDNVIEYYNILNFILLDNEDVQSITLYDLNLTDSTDFQLTFLGIDFIPVSKALVYVDRQYISENIYKTVELPLTDTNGQTVIHLVRNDILYNIRIIKDGVVLGNFERLTAFCEDYTIGNCKIDLSATSETMETFNYAKDLGITFNTPTYDEDTREITFDFLSSNGLAKNVGLTVQNNDIFGNRTLCNSTIYSSGGSLSCTVPSSIEDSTLLMSIYVGDDLVGINNIKIATTNYGEAGYLIYLFMMISFILLFIESKSGVLIGIGLGFVSGVVFGLINDSIIGWGSSGGWILFIIIFGLWRLNKDRST